MLVLRKKLYLILTILLLIIYSILGLFYLLSDSHVMILVNFIFWGIILYLCFHSSNYSYQKCFWILYVVILLFNIITVILCGDNGCFSMNLAPGITLVCQWNYENKHVTKCKNAKDKTYILAIAFIITIYLIDQIIDYNDWHFNMLPDKNVSNNIAYFNFLILIISTLFSNIGWSSLVDTTAASLEENLQVSDYHATHDPLTGLKNRKSLDKYIEKINAKKLQYIFLLGDIDHFKIINDTYGHDCGDYILIEISKILQQNIRSSDQIFRWGGEEIVIIFPETTVNNVYSKAENLRSEIQNSIFTYQDKKIDVTISIGISSSHNKSFIETFKEADSFLYYAKEHGRNMTVYYKK